MSITLLMTATIDPKNCPDTRFSIPERKAQYLSAFKFYLRGLISGKGGYSKMIFAENSGADLADFRNLVPPSQWDRVVLLSADTQLFSPEKGKSYNEALLMDIVLDKVHGDETNELFFKVTGRYSILNIASFIRDCCRQGNVMFYCDQKDHRVFSRLGLKWNEQWGETRYFAFTYSFWMQWFWQKAGRDGRDFEAFIFDVAKANYGTKGCYFRFRQEAFIAGLGGGNYAQVANIPLPRYLERPWFTFRVFTDTVLRILFPRWWF